MIIRTRKNNLTKKIRGGSGAYTQNKWIQMSLREKLKLMLKINLRETNANVEDRITNIEHKFMRLKAIKYYYCFQNKEFIKTIDKVLNYLTEPVVKPDLETEIDSIFKRKDSTEEYLIEQKCHGPSPLYLKFIEMRENNN